VPIPNLTNMMKKKTTQRTRTWPPGRPTTTTHAPGKCTQFRRIYAKHIQQGHSSESHAKSDMGRRDTWASKKPKTVLVYTF